MFDLADILADSRLVLYIPEITESIEMLTQRYLSYEDYKITEFCILPGYDVLYHDVCEDFMNTILKRITDEIIGKSTKEYFQRIAPQHTLYHMRNMLQHRNIWQLKEKINEVELTNIPAIIVSAGPSLDKNVQELKNAEGKSLIIVVDAALRTVQKAGVHPDIVCTIDPEPPDRFFEGLDLDDMVWCCERLTRPWILEHYGKRVYYYGFFEKRWNDMLEETLNYKFPGLVSGGSVTSIAFSLACYLGFRKIILVGQDMAFTGGTSHTKGIEGAFGDNDEYIQSRKLLQVEGIDGTLLETDVQMWYYKQWFEKAFKANENELQVINATEGGAKIEGAKNQTLISAIEQECCGNFTFEQMEKDIPPAFEKKEKEKEGLLHQLDLMEEQVDRLEKMIVKTMEHQKKILSLLKGNTYKGNNLKKELIMMTVENEKLEQMPLFDIMTQYAQKEEYEMVDNIYADETMEIQELVERSLTLYEGYKKAVGMLAEDMHREFIYKI